MAETGSRHPDLTATKSWRMRKEQTLHPLADTDDPKVRKLWQGDKLSFIRSFARAFDEQERIIWQVCNRKDPSMQAWYYRSIAVLLQDLTHYPACQDYIQLKEPVFAGVTFPSLFCPCSDRIWCPLIR